MDFPHRGAGLALYFPQYLENVVKLHKICEMTARDPANHGESTLRAGFEAFEALGLPAATLRRGPKTAKWGSEHPQRPRKPVSYGVLKMKTPQDTLLAPL